MSVDDYKLRRLMDKVESLTIDATRHEKRIAEFEQVTKLRQQRDEFVVRVLDQTLRNVFGIEHGEYSAERVYEFARRLKQELDKRFEAEG